MHNKERLHSSLMELLFCPFNHLMNECLCCCLFRVLETGSHIVFLAGFKLTAILLLQPLKYQDYRYEPERPNSQMLFFSYANCPFLSPIKGENRTLVYMQYTSFYIFMQHICLVGTLIFLQSLHPLIQQQTMMLLLNKTRSEQALGVGYPYQ